MAEMWRLLEDAHFVSTYARKIATSLNHTWIMPEHILLAMTHVEAKGAFHVLSDLDIIESKLNPFLKPLIKLPENPPIELELSASAKKLLELSVVIAKEHKHYEIDSINILIALARLEHKGIEAVWQHFQLEKSEIIEVCEIYWQNLASEGRSPHPENDLINGFNNQIGVEVLKELKRMFRFFVSKIT